MNTTQLDERGVVESCPHCGQRNRILYSRFAEPVRCGRCKAELPLVSEPIEISDDSAFDQLVESISVPLVVDFWAEWCGPCKMMAPELHKFAAAHAGRIAVAKVNSEGLPTLAQRFGIAAIPTLVLFDRGREAGRAQGARSSSQIEGFVRRTLGM